MKRRLIEIVALGVLSPAAVGLLWLRQPTSTHAQSGCSIDMLQGTYGIHAQGWMPAPGASTPSPFAQAGLMSIDGAGGVSLAVTNSMGGQISRDTLTYSSQLNPDCTGSLTPKPGVAGGPADFVLVDGGKRMLFVVTLAQAGVVMSGEAIRQ